MDLQFRGMKHRRKLHVQQHQPDADCSGQRQALALSRANGERPSLETSLLKENGARAFYCVSVEDDAQREAEGSFLVTTGDLQHQGIGLSSHATSCSCTLLTCAEDDSNGWHILGFGTMSIFHNPRVFGPLIS